MVKKELVLEIVVFLYVCLFLYAAGSKAMEYDTFGAQIRMSPLLNRFADLLIYAIPAVEVLIAILLLVPRFCYAGFLSAFTLMVTFTVYITVILTSDKPLPCSCGGVLALMGWKAHLVFNLVFVALAIVGVNLVKKPELSVRTNQVVISVLTLLSVSIVLALSFFSVNTLDKPGGFRRVLINDFVKIVARAKLPDDSYYLAGSVGNRMLFSSLNKPFNLLSFSDQLNNRKELIIKVDGGKPEVLNQNISIQIDSPFFYLKDKDKPIIYRGHTSNWLAKPILSHTPYFTQAYAMSPNSAVFTAYVNQKGVKIDQTVFGKVSDHLTSILWNTKHLRSNVEGLYSSMGILRFNRDLSQFVYVCNYSNRFIVLDTNLNLIRSGRTIDTITKPQINPREISKGRFMLASPEALINKNVEVYRQWMFVNSGALSANEKETSFRQSSAIDIYDLKENRYRFSFYLPDYNGVKVRTYRIINNRIIATYGNDIIIYQYDILKFEKDLKNLIQG